MNRHDVVIIKDTHRGLLYEDGVFRRVLAAGRYRVPRQPSRLASFFGAKVANTEIVLVDVRPRDRIVVIPDYLAADGATISATFALRYRVVDAHAALHEARSFDDRACAETQSAARRVLRGLSLEEILGSRDEIGEELHRQVAGSALAFGLEVSGLDFKDLVIPADLRASLTRAALSRRLRPSDTAGALPPGDRLDRPRPFDPDSDPDEDDDPSHSRAPSAAHVEPLLIHRPDGVAAARERSVVGFDPALRRFRS